MKMNVAHVYKAHDGWRWRLLAVNGKIVAESGEAYARRHNAIRAVTRTRNIFNACVINAEDA